MTTENISSYSMFGLRVYDSAKVLQHHVAESTVPGWCDNWLMTLRRRSRSNCRPGPPPISSWKQMLKIFKNIKLLERYVLSRAV